MRGGFDADSGGLRGGRVIRAADIFQITLMRVFIRKHHYHTAGRRARCGAEDLHNVPYRQFRGHAEPPRVCI